MNFSNVVKEIINTWCWDIRLMSQSAASSKYGITVGDTDSISAMLERASSSPCSNSDLADLVYIIWSRQSSSRNTDEADTTQKECAAILKELSSHYTVKLSDTAVEVVRRKVASR